MLEVREIEIALRKLSGGTAQLRTSERTLLDASNFRRKVFNSASSGHGSNSFL